MAGIEMTFALDFRCLKQFKIYIQDNALPNTGSYYYANVECGLEWSGD